MATELGTYYVSLVPSAINITGHAQKAFAPVQGVASRAGEESGGHFSSAFSRATSGIGHTLGNALKIGTAVATSAIAAAGAVGVKTASQLETAQISFTTMLGSAEKAQSFLGDLKKFAAKTPFDLPGLQTAAQSLISIGLGSEKVLPIMTTLGNVTSGMGTGAEGIKRATVALQQMNAAGKISAEDLNQLRDAGIPVYDLLTAATGKSTAQISEMRDKGQLGREELEALMSALETGRGFERFNGLMEAQSASLSGLWSTLKDTFGVGMADIIEPLMPLIKSGLGGAISFLSDTVVPKGTAAMASFMATLTQSGGVIDKARDSYYLFKSALQGGTGDGEGWVSAETAARIQAVGGAVRNVVLWIGQLDFSSVQGFFSSLHLEALAPAFDSIGTSMTALVPAAGEFATSFAAMTPDVLATGVNLLAGALGFLADHTDWIIAHMPLIVAGFVAWKVAQMGVNFVTAASVPLMLAANVARTAAAVAEYRLVTAQHAAITAGAAKTTQQNLGMVATVRGTVATVAHNAAVLGSSVATRVAAAAQWLWNAALSSNPIALVVKGLALLVGGMVWFFTQTDIGRGIIAGAWGFIQGAIGGVVAWFRDVAMPIAASFFGGIGDAASGASTNTTGAFGGIQSFIGGVVSWFRDVALPIAGAVFGGIADAAGVAFGVVSTVIGVAWAIVSGIFNAWVFVFTQVVFPVFRALWEDVVQPVFFLAGEFIKFWWNLVQGIFEVAVSVLTNVVFPIFRAFYDDVVAPVFNAIGAVIGWVWNNLVLPVFGAIIGFIVGSLTPPFNTFLGVVTTVWNGVSGAISGTWNWIKDNVFTPMSGFLQNDLPGYWTTATTMIGTAWDAIQDIAKKPIKWVIEEVINKGIVDTFNNIAGKLPGVNKLEKVKLPDGWARGGVLPGYRTTKSDDVMTPMRSGEGVLVPEAVRGIGAGTIHALNAAGNRGGVAAVKALVSGFAFGGVVGEDDDRKRRRGKKPPPGAVFAGGPGTTVFGQPSYNWPLQDQIFSSRRLFVSQSGVPGSYNLNRSINQWNGIANLELIPLSMTNARGRTGGSVKVTGMEAGAGIAGWYSGNNIVLDTPGMGDSADQVVAVHELGHALGLPHAHRYSANGQGGGTGEHSVMNYDTQWSTGGTPTAADRRYLKSIYPGIVMGPTQERESDGDGGFNPFQGLIDGLGGLVKGAFPDGGMMVDAAIGTGKKALTDISGWVLSKIGGFWDWLTGNGGDKGGPDVPGDVSSWATEGLKRTGALEGGNLASLTRRIMQESSGDPRAVNMWDTNASIGGTHGLMQLLKSNFNTYRDANLANDIYHPLANIVAGINYTKNRYGGNLRAGWDRPGGYAMGGIIPTLFDTGGYLPTGPTMVDNQRRRPEAILTDSQWEAMYDIAANTDGGGRDVYVQLPFTDDYVLAHTTPAAVSATGEALVGAGTRVRRGGKYAGSRGRR